MSIEREIEKLYTLPEFVAELRRLADVLESKQQFNIQIEDENIFVPEHAVAAVVYEIEGGHAEIEFQLSWETGEVAADEDEDADEDDADEDEDAEDDAEAVTEAADEAEAADAAEVEAEVETASDEADNATAEAVDEAEAKTDDKVPA
ncbi:hypothetical protein [Zavarzinia compransoris]|uniref:hypothetical protein n=1 Tax=Zavarzinia compransoris TaxID=1264899 RepID=UPI0010EDFDB6|nr:hypothetical protein [Zavarzinia compransoris]TDP46454.1 hypothetical protein DES42_104544 [Zavarzinia compransoris]